MSDMQNLFRKEREAWLSTARSTAYDLLLSQQTITIEDVLKICPRPSYLHPGVTGHVFQDVMFRPVGFRKSLRPISNGRVVRVWTLSNAYMPKTYRKFKKRKLEQYA